MKHITDRHWDNNPPRGLAISIALEANELLEHFQWQEDSIGNTDEIAEELADVFIYAIQFANHYDIDITKSIMKKLDKSSKKYPVEHFAEASADERKEAWLKAKKEFKKDTVL
ncbi:MAG: nucleotide pyrophosphohydrolase [Candidatus Saccharibacteria bacterium]|jgi:NTP pyrophosphatase (non-canonical NTP hydrolase)|nr:MAG: nucleotide pyrophosphohydrolase [Candidatus Saccharibacteria bacterium]